MKQLGLLCMIILATIASAFAQTDSITPSDTRGKTCPFQMSFVYPLGTNGLYSHEYENNVSFNLLAGVSSGVHGIEFAGFANVTNGNVRGIQIAGFSNLVEGELLGTQIAGFINMNKGKAQGAQLAGFTNISLDSVNGVQLSGYYNQNAYNLRGIQASGFVNNSLGNVQGQQLTGFLNVAAGNVDGMQLAGFANLTSDTLRGVQVSGFLNVAKTVQGMQIGFINICDTISGGMPIGFLSIVRKGYKKFEVEMSDYYYLSANIKTGHRSFYNIFSAHVRPEKEDIMWGFGYGIGTSLNAPKFIGLNLDATLSHINVGNDFKVNINEMLQIKLNGSLNFGDNFALYGGPSVKFLVRDTEVKSVFSNPIYTWKDGGYASEMALGLNVGLRF